jgi:hypothetical protein
MSGDGAAAARALMTRFEEATAARAGRRYLWTDAFAVCAWIALGETDRATALVDAVHGTLGRHRPDDPREGWISGLDEETGAEHPTAGGLRIGKPLPERPAGEPYDPLMEWERDGQYFHYLTRWVRALRRTAEATGDPRYDRWGAELARVAFRRFGYGIGPVPNRLHWKMSIDLARPLVPSMGQHDPLDGYVTMAELVAAGADAGLEEPMEGLAGMGEASDWATEDPLGAGALLADGWVLARLVAGGAARHQRTLDRVLEAALKSVRAVGDSGALELPTSQRLAFRELGLAIGLAGVERLAEDESVRGGLSPAGTKRLDELTGSLPLRAAIVEHWMDPRHRRASSWDEHEDISTVMLATALVPDGYLGRSGG